MASTILLKRSNTASNDAYTGPLGEVTLDTQARKLRIHDGVQVGGYTVANMADIQAVVNQVTELEITDIAGLEAALNSITSDVSDHETRLTSVETSYINKDGTVAFTGDVDVGGNNVTNIADPVNNTDAANKRYVDNEISALGDVFSYEGTIDAGSQGTPFDLSTLGDTTTGSYYTVTTAGYITNDGGTTSEFVNLQDAVLFSASGYRIIDNTNAEVSGTLDYIEVSGSPDTGYTVDVDDTFKGRVSGLETDVALKANAANAALTGDAVLDGTLDINSGVNIGSGSSAIDVFSITDPTDASLFAVKENGDVVIGGVLTVNGTGTSTFAGSVDISGAITIGEDVNVNADFNGNDLTLSGNLAVNGNTTLGDSQLDTTTITGATTIDGVTQVKSQVTKANGDDTTDVFSVVDSNSLNLLSVKTNGDVDVGGVLTIADGATINGEFTGDDLTLHGNLVVNGNTTLGDNASDSVSLVATTTATTQPVTDSTTKVATTGYVRNFVESGTYTIDGGTF